MKRIEKIPSDDFEFNIDEFSSEIFWDKKISNLHTSFSTNFKPIVNFFELDKESIELSKTRLITEGYIQLPKLHWEDWFLNVREGIKYLKNLNIPVPFIFMFCEPWMMHSQLSRVVESLFGEEYCLLPEFWAWHVDPNNEDAGWGPHRDKGRWSLYENGKPKSLTLWIPLTDATIENSCMHLIPANRDSSYQLEEWKKELIDLQNIVALPVKAGTPLIWNSNVIHWGSKSLPRNTSPRISVAFEVQITKMEPFNKPTMGPLEIPNFENRLKLICKQILQYSHLYPLQTDLEIFAKKQLNIKS
jgi:hypothetical protein